LRIFTIVIVGECRVLAVIAQKGSALSAESTKIQGGFLRFNQ